MESDNFEEKEAELIEVDVMDSSPPDMGVPQDITKKNGEINGECDKNNDSLSVNPLSSTMDFSQIKLEISSSSAMTEKTNVIADGREEADGMPQGIGCLDKVQFDSLDEGIPDENDIYNRFYFESDHLALKDNSE